MKCLPEYTTYDVAEWFLGTDLKPTGDGKWVAHCPLHQDKQPSFFVYGPGQGDHYHCFGCNAHGDGITLVQHMLSTSFPEAVNWVVANVVQGDAPHGSPSGAVAVFGHRLQQIQMPEQCDPGLEPESLLEAVQLFVSALPSAQAWMGLMAHWTQYRVPGLEREPVGERKPRISAEAVTSWNLRFATPEGIARYIAFCQERALVTAAVHVGLLWPAGDGAPMARRIIIPIRDAGGTLVSVVGRGTGTAPPKYRNCRATRVWGKRDELFGVHKALPAIQQDHVAILVEGYFDTIVLHEAGLTCAVGLGSASLSDNQARQLVEIGVRELHYIADGDGPGVDAAQRAVAKLVMGSNMCCCVSQCPEGTDPEDELRRLGVAEFKRKYLGSA